MASAHGVAIMLLLLQFDQPLRARRVTGDVTGDLASHMSTDFDSQANQVNITTTAMVATAMVMEDLATQVNRVTVPADLDSEVNQVNMSTDSTGAMHPDMNATKADTAHSHPHMNVSLADSLPVHTWDRASLLALLTGQLDPKEDKSPLYHLGAISFGMLVVLWFVGMCSGAWLVRLYMKWTEHDSDSGSAGMVYEWDQTPARVTMYAKLPKGILAEHLDVVLHRDHIMVGYVGEHPVTNEKLHAEIDCEASFWLVNEEEEELQIHLHKVVQEEWPRPMTSKEHPDGVNQCILRVSESDGTPNTD